MHKARVAAPTLTTAMYVVFDEVDRLFQGTLAAETAVLLHLGLAPLCLACQHLYTRGIGRAFAYLTAETDADCRIRCSTPALGLRSGICADGNGAEDEDGMARSTDGMVRPWTRMLIRSTTFAT